MLKRVWRISSVAAGMSLCGATLSAQLPDYRLISSAPTCAACSITLEPGATLRLPNDSLSFGYTSALIRLGDGKVLAWDLNETRLPVLFDANGQFVRVIARSGNGPGEMGHIAGIFVGRGDSIWVMDFDPWTWHVLTPDVRYVRRAPLEPEPFDMLFAPGGGSVMATEIHTPGHFGYPLQLIDANGNALKPFGLERPVTVAEKRASSSILIRFLTVDPAGQTFWARQPGRFLLEQYDFSGRLVARVRHQLDGWYKTASEQQPGEGDFNGKALGLIVPSREPGILWLLYYVRNASYVRPTGMLELGTYDGMHDVVIEAFDTRSYKVVASQRFERIAVRGVRNAPDMVSVTKPVSADFQTHQLYTLRLVRR